jgi:hypothetical protein
VKTECRSADTDAERRNRFQRVPVPVPVRGGARISRAHLFKKDGVLKPPPTANAESEPEPRTNSVFMTVIERRPTEAPAPCSYRSPCLLRPVPLAHAAVRCVLARRVSRCASQCAWQNASRLFSSMLSVLWTCETLPSSLPPCGVSWPCALLQVNGRAYSNLIIFLHAW